jgi:RsiW-degrading membrane proteinase PrsW (M82 family)
LIAAAFIPLPQDDLSFISLGIFLALVPAVVWLGFFYQRDHVEPEPKRLVARIFLFGALAAAAVAVPIAELFFETTIVQLNSVFARFVVTVFSVSLIQEALKLAMVRYVVLGTDEFDEHPDGIVYGLAAGLGFATVLNIDFVLQSGGVLPLQAAIQATNNALVHGALGAFTGYFVGRVKLDGERVGWLAAGLAVATAVNGLYHTASAEVTSLGLSFQPLNALIVAIILALIMGLVLFSLFQRAHGLASGQLTTITQQAQARSFDMPWDIAPRYDGVIVGVLLIALVIGWGAGLILDQQVTGYSDDELPVTLSYPSDWAIDSSGGGLLLTDLGSGVSFNPTFQVATNRVPVGAILETQVDERIARQEQQLDFYQVVSREPGPVIGGQPTERVVYQYVTLTSGGPVVVRGTDTLLIHSDRLYVYRLVAEDADYAESLETYERILSTVRYQ